MPNKALSDFQVEVSVATVFSETSPYRPVRSDRQDRRPDQSRFSTLFHQNRAFHKVSTGHTFATFF